jgi:hypothetical protein
MNFRIEYFLFALVAAFTMNQTVWVRQLQHALSEKYILSATGGVE